MNDNYRAQNYLVPTVVESSNRGERAYDLYTYKPSARDEGFDWVWKHKAPGQRGAQNDPNTAVDLAATMRTNPAMKALFLNGYYDAATPFYGTEFDVAHMLLPPALQKNVTFKYYPSGHMVYLNPAELAHMHDDLAAWYDSLGAR